MAWLLRKYLEQQAVAGFERMKFEQRRRAIEQYRNRELRRLQSA